MKKNNLYTKLSRAIQKGDLLYKIFCYILIKMNFSNDMLQALEIRNKKFHRVQKKYKKYLIKYDYKSSINKNDIWICWFQGMDNAPSVVKKCYESIKKYNSDKNIHVITEKNMFEYIELPEYIINKWKKGIISYTHLSDIIRTELLIKYGGLWVDATTYFTDSIPDYVYNKDLFLYKYYDSSDITIRFNSWFIYSSKDNAILKNIRDLLYAYWKKERKLSEYFLWHFFLTMSYEYNYEKYCDIYKITDENCHTLQNEILNTYDSEYYEVIKKYSPIHKLTYKIDFDNIAVNSYYEKIMNDKGV